MTRHEAKMVAEELMKLQPADYRGDEFLSSAELALRLNISESMVRHSSGLPRINIGKAVRYPLNQVINYLKKRK